VGCSGSPLQFCDLYNKDNPHSPNQFAVPHLPLRAHQMDRKAVLKALPYAFYYFLFDVFKTNWILMETKH
jgi:hypothetical protein